MKKSIILFLSFILITSAAFGYTIKGTIESVETPVVKIKNNNYILLLDVCRAYGIDLDWDSFSRRISLIKNERKADFLLGSKYYAYGERIKTLKSPLEIESGNIYIPLYFAKSKIKNLFKIKSKDFARVKRSTEKKVVKKDKDKTDSKAVKKRYAIRKIVIDPGHGGKDPGAIGKTGLYEKDVVLDVAKRIKRELEKSGLTAILTRETDKFITLKKRTDIANSFGADLFISVHANANNSRWVRGFEVYYLSEAMDDCARALATSENSVLKYEDESFNQHTQSLDAIVWDLTLTENREESIELATYVCQEVGRDVSVKSNSVKCARFYVLKGAQMPAVLVELSYLSNAKEEKDLRKSSYKESLAKAIAGGIVDYKYEYEKTNGFSN